MKSLYFILPAVFALNAVSAFALEIDEKLTLRFLKVSSTKKTVLINRGGEDGLVVGDHAKFFITAGVVARGVAEKVSPSRSVWSLYRIVDEAEITQDKVLNLKIASPVKITDDPSKSLKEEAIPSGNETMSVEENSAVQVGAEASSEKEVVVSDSEMDELKGLGDDEEVAPKKVSAPISKSSKKAGRHTTATVVEDLPVTYSSNTSRTWEVWGTMYINSLSGTTKSESTTETESLSSSASTVDFSLGAEKYFLNYSNFLRETSLAVFIHKKTVESGDRIKSKTDWFEYGFGANYHFYNSAASMNKLVGFGTLTLGKGSATVASTTVVNGVSEEASVEGTNSFFSIGLGAKYVLNNGFGIRGVLDYYRSAETYEYASSTDTRTLAGPRIHFGISYRF